ncbi:MarR family transcriptional regulator [Salinicoccus sp. ID82-1]|uniref:MarR family transcriptional regulator n=1 Tax=Salinicoccus cyprini TaxID=2493691 RepID=A0A558ATZ5_9STAP|nr:MULTISPECIES: MarR family transcriptional regulator [Salinicoccus]MCG1010787.1 MarR family transcriptional regulator [Salinicoccus sp. ID82-1]TVT27731.1 MarR family transcriptional regulator [Salinicoccus cyprini]
MQTDHIRLANQLCFSVYNTSRLFTKFYQRALSDFGLTYSQYLVLMALWEEDGQTLHQIGDALYLESNTLTPLLRRMEDAGWLTREKSAHDRRQLTVHLTAEGQESQGPIQQAIAECIGKEHLDIDQYNDTQETISQLETALRTLLTDESKMEE